MKPDPGNSQDLFIRSLSALGTEQFSFLFFSRNFKSIHCILVKSNHVCGYHLEGIFFICISFEYLFIVLMLMCLAGIDVTEHDIRFVEDNWESPVIYHLLLLDLQTFGSIFLDVFSYEHIKSIVLFI